MINECHGPNQFNILLSKADIVAMDTMQAWCPNFDEFKHLRSDCLVECQFMVIVYALTVPRVQSDDYAFTVYEAVDGDTGRPWIPLHFSNYVPRCTSRITRRSAM